ncbi:5-methylcytosine restriction system specificity protein McrC, partial [Aeromonas veronii]
PKTHDAAPDENMASEVSRSRRMLKRMLASAMDLPLREAEEAGLELGEGSLSEWVMGRFLSELEHLVRHGLRFDYVQVE